MTGSSGRAWRLKPLLIVVLAVAIIAAIGYAYASPYVALGRLKSAIDARDAQAISEYVDFPSLRISLKQQVTEELMRRIDAVKKNNPFAVIGALIGSALIGPLVDAYATPEGVAALMSGLPPRGNPGERPPEWSNLPPGSNAPGNTPAAPAANPAPASAAASGSNAATTAASSQPPAAAAPASAVDATHAPHQQQTSAGYRNIDEFVVTYQRSADGTRYAAIFHRFGLFSWKLSAIDLHA
ncbi:DUF2939 domain-containing protein [Burkholderia sp. Ac-20384]|uniref:DUF2939 domain-containing protein n=1 Tax=Burkholderia lata (strain ATCC 17760 / DSM 23089 / LMG 22485 / NCIMB 9086 / R18194 / 383) TaxID=482957 RepID=A0A833UQ64_BURL3|nr:DUF2939 domain-containing protein [Burkholderia lata]KAF1039236.1 MAG: hypothetical protein GAK33_01818 [Burkholderia lata]MBN3827226.1 DUF2939 domain-containing protein [Burkholderia sp. Ac-20384]